MPSKKFFALALTAIVGVAGAWVWYTHPGLLPGFTGPAAVAYQTPQEQDPFVRFEMEAYDDIVANYWMSAGQYDLPKLYLLSAEKVTGASTTLATSTRAATAAMLAGAFSGATSTAQKRQWATDTLTVVLYNLQPAGRNQLLSKKQEVALRQEVSNVNPQKDLYGDLGLAKGASAEEVNTAYKQKSAELAASSSPAAKAELAQATYAHQVLANESSKALYDQSQVEPTVFGHIIGHTLYLEFQQIAPTTLAEFARTVDAASTTPGLSSMIIDLRGNIGGALDFATAFTGLFIGQNQYAYDLFRQGEYQPQRTTIGTFDELNRFSKIAVLVDSMTQSTAEATTGILKRYKLATVVGTTTRGWGSVENTYELKTEIDPTTSYALLLVNSLTLRDDEQPIESQGVVPNIPTSGAHWKEELSSMLPSDLASAVRQMLARDPWKF